MPRSRSDIQKYFSDTNTRFGTYHNHKENMAWAVVALYYVAVFKLADLSYSNGNGLSLQRHSLTLVVVVISLIAAAALHRQLYLRRVAADVYTACQRLACKCVTMSDEELEGLDLRLANPTQPDIPPQTPSTFPICLAVEIESVSLSGRRSRRALESLSYALLTVGCATAVSLIWLFEPKASAQQLVTAPEIHRSLSTTECPHTASPTFVANPTISIQVVGSEGNAKPRAVAASVAVAASQACR